jgi:hypothetical protein
LVFENLYQILYNWASHLWRSLQVKKNNCLLSTVCDNRVQGRTKYELQDILTIVFFGTISGCYGWTEIADYAISNAKIFMKILPTLPNIPSVDTIARTVAKLDQSQIREIFTKLATILFG